MKALIVSRANVLEMRDVPSPQIGPYDALVRMEACGVCNSTDQKLIAGTMFWAPPFPFVLGHESVGTVIEVGQKVRKFSVGDRVTRPLAFWQGSCEGLNIANGGFAEFGIVRDGNAMALDGDVSLQNDYNTQRQLIVPKHIDAIHAALSISLAETASVFLPLPNVRGKTILIAGTGVAGFAFGLWAKLAGATVITLGRRNERLELAKQLGADFGFNTTEPGWFERLKKDHPRIDGAIEATGDAPLANKLLPLIAADGFTIAYGVPPTGISYDPRWKNADVNEHLCFDWVVSLISRGWIKPEWFISRVVKMNQAIELIGDVAAGKVLKGFVRIS